MVKVCAISYHIFPNISSSADQCFSVILLISFSAEFCKKISVLVWPFVLVTKTGGPVVVITPVPVHCLPFISSPESKAYKVSV